MAKASVPLMKAEFKRRSYAQAQPDPIADAQIISDKVQRSSCFGATVAGIVLMAAAVWGFIAAVLS